MDYGMKEGHQHKDFFRAQGNELEGLKDAREDQDEATARDTIHRCWILLGICLPRSFKPSSPAAVSSLSSRGSSFRKRQSQSAGCFVTVLC